jgi:RNA polymerase sigma-70 factor (ECF subfamily)
MATRPTERDEEVMRAAWAAGDFEGVTTAALRQYGPELFGFLVSMNLDYDAASDAFALFSEKLWRTLPRFEWSCSLKAWCYRLARNAAIDVHRAGNRRRYTGLSSAPGVSEVAAHVRTSTMSALRTAKRSALERLREELSEEDRAILVLRVDRELGWDEVALVLAAGSEDDDRALDGAALKKEAARLRKRFQLVAERLRALAKERQLL